MTARDGRHGDGVSVEALIEAASEVGIPAAAVRRALALEQLDPVPSTRPTDRIVGPATVTADAEVAGSAAEALAHLDAWLVDGHHLRRDHLRDGRGRWTKRTDIVGAFVRALRCATGEGRLGREVRVAASTSETGTGTTMVRLAVDRARARQAAIVAGVAVAHGGGRGDDRHDRGRRPAVPGLVARRFRRRIRRRQRRSPAGQSGRR